MDSAANTSAGAPPDATARTAPPRFQQQRVAEVVAAALRSQILEGQIVGRLPKQDDLLEEFQVSRQSLREALGILEAQGLISVIRGAVGGAIVHPPTIESAANSLGMILHSQRVDLPDLAAALHALEPLVTGLCAMNATPEFVAHLDELTDAAEDSMSDPVLFIRTAREFHRSIVEGCGSTSLALVVGALEMLWTSQVRRWAENADTQGQSPPESVRREIIDAHRHIIDAIRDGDRERAEHYSQAHLDGGQRYVLTDTRSLRVRTSGPDGTGG